MGIDRIGKGPTPGNPPIDTTNEAAKSGSAASTSGATPSRSFEDVRKDAAGGAQALRTDAVTGPLADLRAGRIDIHRYLDLKVEEATAHLHGLGESDLNTIRDVLRDRLANDPMLRELVRGATGHMPPTDIE